MGLSDYRDFVRKEIGEYLDELPNSVLASRTRARKIMICGSVLMFFTASILELLL
jgi:hypothetical protein